MGVLNAFGEPVGSRQEDLQIWGGEEAVFMDVHLSGQATDSCVPMP